jgi:hypothetical protein
MASWEVQGGWSSIPSRFSPAASEHLQEPQQLDGKRLILWINNDKHVLMPVFDLEKKRPRINIFKLVGAYYFKHFFDDLELFKELEPYYEKQRYRFKMKTAGERNKVMKYLDKKGYDPTLIEDPAPFTVEISRYQKYGELLKNSIESYPLRDKMVLVMKDMAWVEQAVEMGAVVRGGKQ